MCHEIFNNEKSYLHFKVSNANVIQTAYTGNQSLSSISDWQQTLYNLKKPEGWQEYIDKLPKEQIKEIDFSNIQLQGGLVATPFGSSQHNSFWTIVGDDPKNPVFECGTYHRSKQEDKDSVPPAMAKTVHKIFFRGKAPSPKNVRQRMMTLVSKILPKS